MSIFAFLGLIGACTLGGASTTTAGTGGTAAAACVQTDGCEACIACAYDGPCATEYTTCDQDPDCQDVYACVAGMCDPGDTSCQETCEAANSAGATEYEALITCGYCDHCATACTGQCTTSE